MRRAAGSWAAARAARAAAAAAAAATRGNAAAGLRPAAALLMQSRGASGGGGGERVLPSLDLPVYFELKEIGTNYRYASDPAWVLDVVQRDCVREEGLSYVPEASTYSVTFFQLINYCARRGYEVTAYGVQESQARRGRRWAVLHHRGLQQAVQAANPPPHLLAEVGSADPAAVERGLRDGEYVHMDGQVVRTQRRMAPHEMAYYEAGDARTPARVVRGGEAEVQFVQDGDPDSDRPAPVAAPSAAEAATEAATELQRRLDQQLRDETVDRGADVHPDIPAEQRRGVLKEFTKEDGTFKMPDSERMRRGV